MKVPNTVPGQGRGETSRSMFVVFSSLLISIISTKCFCNLKTNPLSPVLTGQAALSSDYIELLELPLYLIPSEP